MNSSLDATQTPRFCYTGSSRSLVSLSVQVFFLSFLTCLIYLPFGVRRLRAYVWSHIEIDGVALTYDGTVQTQMGQKSLASRVGIFYFLLTYLAYPLSLLVRSVGFGRDWHLSLFGLLIAPFVVFGGSQYRLQHTLYKGVRLALGGDALAYSKIYLRRLIPAVLTLGYLWPELTIATNTYALGHLRWGGHPISYAATLETATPLYRRGILLSIITLGLYTPWFIADVRNYHVSAMRVGGVQLRSHQTGSALMSLYAGNAMIRMLTFGFGAGWATTRTLRYAMQTISMQGDLLALPSAQPDVLTSTGLADLCSVDQWIV